jgi:hypothetical protein
MSDYFNLATLVAFFLGVLLSAMVKSMLSRVRGAV